MHDIKYDIIFVSTKQTEMKKRITILSNLGLACLPCGAVLMACGLLNWIPVAVLVIGIIIDIFTVNKV